MQASYASGCALGSPHRILGTRKSMRTIQYGFACLMRTFSKATEARSAVVAGQTGVRCTPSARLAHFAAHHFSLKCAGDFSCFLSFMSLFQCFLASLHAMHTFFPMTYIHARGIYIFSYIRLKKRCAWRALTLNPLINQDLSCTLWPKMVCRIVCMACRVVCTNDGTHE